MSAAFEPRKLSLSHFLERFSSTLCHATANQLTPLFTAAMRTAAEQVFRQFATPLFPAQANIAAALAHALTMHPAAVVAGEMGCGKSRIAVATAVLAQSRRTLILAPPHLVRKWADEVHALVPGAATAIPRSLSDIDQMLHPPPTGPWPHFVILSRERAKLSYAIKPALVPRRWRFQEEEHLTYRCPQCGEVPHNSDDIPLTPHTLKGRAACHRCHSPLWTYSEDGPRRFALADYIKRHYPTAFDTAIIDELHEYKSGGSAQALACATVLQLCRRAIALTGTLSSGKSTSLFHLLWRITPEIRAAYEHNAESRWVDHYGVWETRTQDVDSHKVILSGKESKRRVYVSVRERPGISPHLIPHLVSKTAFFQLRDLGIALPPYTETVLECTMEGPLQEHYRQLKQAARDLIQRGRKTRDGHLLSSTIQSLLAYPDRCWQDEVITDRDGTVLFRLPALPTSVCYPKEAQLVQTVRREQARGRRVLIFCTHTQTRDITKRLALLMTHAGLRAHVLPASVAPERRMTWITDRVKQGCDVLLCNPKLVQTGLDLNPFPTIVWSECEYSTFVVRQASRRSWRIGQAHPVSVIFTLYKNSFQQQAWALVAAGIRASLETEGDVTHEGLSHYQQTEDLLTQLIRQVLDDHPHVLSAERMFADLAHLYRQSQETLTEDAREDPMSPDPPLILMPAPPRPDRASSSSAAAGRPIQLNLFAA